MQDARAPNRAATKGSLTATAGLLCLLSAPLLAATGVDIICDQSARHVDSHAVDDLNIETVDHGITNAITADSDLSGGGSDEEAEVLALSAREEEILRRIFDETVADFGDNSADSDDDIDTTSVEEQSDDITDTEPAVQEDSDTDLPAIRLPDSTAEGMLRYRRQMFRTDI